MVGKDSELAPRSWFARPLGCKPYGLCWAAIFATVGLPLVWSGQDGFAFFAVFFDPHEASVHAPPHVLAVVVFALAIGAALTVRRLVDLGASRWWGLVLLSVFGSVLVAVLIFASKRTTRWRLRRGRFAAAHDERRREARQRLVEESSWGQRMPKSREGAWVLTAFLCGSLLGGVGYVVYLQGPLGGVYPLILWGGAVATLVLLGAIAAFVLGFREPLSPWTCYLHLVTILGVLGSISFAVSAPVEWGSTVLRLVVWPTQAIIVVLACVPTLAVLSVSLVGIRAVVIARLRRLRREIVNTR